MKTAQARAAGTLVVVATWVVPRTAALTLASVLSQADPFGPSPAGSGSRS